MGSGLSPRTRVFRFISCLLRRLGAVFPFWLLMLRRTSPNSSRPDQRSVIPPGAWRPRLTRLRGVAKLLASYAVMALVMMQVGCSFKEPQSTLDPHGFVSR